LTKTQGYHNEQLQKSRDKTAMDIAKDESLVRVLQQKLPQIAQEVLTRCKAKPTLEHAF